MRGCFSRLLTGLAFIGLALMAAGYAVLRRSGRIRWSKPAVRRTASRRPGWQAGQTGLRHREGRGRVSGNRPARI